MKNIILSFALIIGLSTFSIAQQKLAFTFVRSTALDIEKRADADGMDAKLYSTPELKKRMLGMFPIMDITSTVDYNSEKYIKFSAIPSTEKFEMITDSEYGSSNWEANLFLQNIKTKQKYAVMVYPMRNYQDYRNMANDVNGNGWLTKDCPKELSQDEKIILAKYKSLIKSANQNIATLLTIQKKYLTRGYFDEEKVGSSDKIIYNKNIDSLKAKSAQLKDLEQDEDNDRKIQFILTDSEISSLINISSWDRNQYKLN